MLFALYKKFAPFLKNCIIHLAKCKSVQCKYFIF